MSDIKIGDRFGRWTVIGKGKKRYYSLCKCDCGTVREVSNRNLKEGISKSCGCLKKQRNRELSIRRMMGRRKGMLTVIGVAPVQDKPNQILYICQCDCGNQITLPGKTLSRSSTQISCGCHRDKKAKEQIQKIKGKREKALKELQYDGTMINTLTQKLAKNSTSGYRGVTKMKNGKYRVDIGIKRKRIYIGTYTKLGDAVKARKEAEEKYYDPVIEEWEETREK